MQINIHEAKTNLSRILSRVESGEEIVIAKAGKPVARLIPVRDDIKRRTPGSAKGKIIIGAHFEDPLPDELVREFES